MLNEFRGSRLPGYGAFRIGAITFCVHSSFVQFHFNFRILCQGFSALKGFLRSQKEFLRQLTDYGAQVCILKVGNSSEWREIRSLLRVDLANLRREVTMRSVESEPVESSLTLLTAFRRALMKLNRKFWRRNVRGLLSLSVLLGVCALLLPLPFAPLPQNLPDKDSSEPFPCQHRPCGCRSAEQCWKKCCCFDNRQKIAWAKANNVRVPDSVVQAFKKENERAIAFEICSAPATKPIKPTDIHSAGCCKHSARKSVAVTKLGRPDSRTCRIPEVAKRSTSRSTSERFETPAATAKSKWVLAIFAAECAGQGPPAFCFPVSIIPERITLQMPSIAAIETVPLESERLQHASLRPPLPPPKIV